MGLSNEFGWSISREAMFDSCPRRYYFHYYLSWGGWESGAEPLAREAFRLKRLVSLALWRGQLVHYVTTKVLASLRARKRIPAYDDVRGYTLERFDAQYAFSRDLRYRGEPKKRGGKLNIDWLALFEHEYRLPIEEQRLSKARDECVTAMRNLLESEILRRIAATDSDGWAIENIDLGEFAQVFDFEGARVFAKTDLMFRGGDGTFNIVDWKTFSGGAAGRDEEKTSLQLGVYGFYAAEILGEPLERIRLIEVNLLDRAAETEHTVAPQDLERFRLSIRAGIGRLAAVLEDGDIARNRPLPPHTFPPVENGRCRYCNFFRICKDTGNPDRLPA